MGRAGACRGHNRCLRVACRLAQPYNSKRQFKIDSDAIHLHPRTDRSARLLRGGGRRAGAGRWLFLPERLPDFSGNWRVSKVWPMPSCVASFSGGSRPTSNRPCSRTSWRGPTAISAIRRWPPWSSSAKTSLCSSSFTGRRSRSRILRCNCWATSTNSNARARQTLNVLGATSGDTGAAAIHGLLGKPGVAIFILYPDGRIAPLQERQMPAPGRRMFLRSPSMARLTMRRRL